MAAPAYSIPTYVRGDLVQSTMNFYSDPAQTVPADPTGVTAEVKNGQFKLAPYIYGVGGFITKVSTGVYYVQVDTTPCNGIWVVRWAGTGAVQKAFEDRWMVYSEL